ncbi:MAG: cupin domain-containing protein [Acidobacteria bacterium]|nr:cupin domain-containing protein [Acidobacteriota bacterium]
MSAAVQFTSWDKVEPEQMNDKIVRQMLSGGQATVARIYLAKGAAVPRHQHISEQYTFVISGLMKLVFDDREVLVRPGDIVLIPSNVPHAAEAVEDTLDIDFFAPRREDWIAKDDAYLRKQ